MTRPPAPPAAATDLDCRLMAFLKQRLGAATPEDRQALSRALGPHADLLARVIGPRTAALFRDDRDAARPSQPAAAG